MPLRFHDLSVEMVPITAVGQHPENPNNGEVDAIAASIEVNGYYSPVVVQRSTGRILAGNHRYVALLDLGANEIPVIYVDVDDEAALRILLADNRTAALARIDDALLTPLLDRLAASEDGLLGTGYEGWDDPPLAPLPPEEVWADHRPLLRVRCATLSDALDLEAELIERGMEVERI